MVRAWAEERWCIGKRVLNMKQPKKRNTDHPREDIAIWSGKTCRQFR